MDDRERNEITALDETAVALRSFRETGQPHELLSALRWLNRLIEFHVKHPPVDATPP